MSNKKPGEGSQYSSYGVAIRLLKDYVSRYKKKIYIAILAMAIFAIASAFNVWLVKPTLDGIFLNKEIKLLWIVPLLVMVVSTIKAVSDYIQSYYIKFVGQNIINDIQLDLYKHLISADLKFLNQHSSGDLISKFTNDILNLKNSISAVIVNLAKEFLTIVFLVLLMFYNDLTLSLITFIVFPLAVIPISKMGKKMRRVAHRTQEQLCDYVVKLDENFRNIKVIKSFCTEDHEIKDAKIHLHNLLGSYEKATRIESATSPVMEMLGAVAVASIILYGGYQVLEGVTSPGSFFSFIVAFLSAYQPVKSVANLNVTLQNGLASARRIFATLDIHPEAEITKSKNNFAPTSPPLIRFENISFTHHKKKHTLEDISFEVKPNQFVALVGESGSGKSTLLDLLLKFYKFDHGEIYLDKNKLSELSPKSIRKLISFVSQDIMLFDASIKENIRYGTPNASDEEIEHAATMASANQFINDLPEKYNTSIGQFGIQLSGGQKQKIAIARALLKNTPVIVFDEATSSLDQVSEQMIKKSLLQIRNNKTIIMITHRLSTIKDADVIHVIKKGKLVESGKHDKLIENKGEYYRLYSKKIVS